jgi:hypothetical protein
MLSPDSYRFMAFTPGSGGNFISALFHQLATNESYLLAKDDSNEYKYVTHSCASLSNYDISKQGNNWLDNKHVAFYVGNLNNNLEECKEHIQYFFNKSEFSKYHNASFKYHWIISHMIQPGVNLVLQETTDNIYEKNILLLYKRAITGITFHPDGTIEPCYNLGNLDTSGHFKQIVKNIIHTKENKCEILIKNQIDTLKFYKNNHKIMRNIEWSNLLSPNYKKSEWEYLVNFFGLEEFYDDDAKRLCMYNAIDEYIYSNTKIIESDTGKGIRELLEKHT